MAVRIQFDEMHNAIQPTLVLATRSGRKLGAIPAHGIHISDKLTTGAELQFQVHKETNGVQCAVWDDITDLKLAWSPEWDRWFELAVEINEQDETIKNVSAVTVGEAELSQINLYDIGINTEDDIARDDYVPTTLYDEYNAEASLLDRILTKAPHYTIAHVDDSLKGIQRTFQFDNTTIYDALQEIAKEIDCLFIIDSGSNANGGIARRISAYDLESVCLDCGKRGTFTGACPDCGGTNIYDGYGDDTNIFVSAENLASEITYTTDKDSVKNCFRLAAGDDMMTSAVKSCNPNGSNYIWYIPDDMRNDMSEALRTRLAEYDAAYQYYKEENSVMLDEATVTAYNALVTKYRAYDASIEEATNQVTGHAELIHRYYNALDFKIYLEDALMPTVAMSQTSAEEQAARLTANALSPVAVTNLPALSEATASGAVLAMAKAIVNPRYQVKVNASSLSGTTWTGSFTVTNYSDDEDTAVSQNVNVVINDSYETFVRQKLTKAMSEESDDVTDIVTLFGLGLDAFKNEIKKYCLTSLTQFNDSCLACMNILIEQGIADGSTWVSPGTDLYDALYVPYYEKQMALQDEIKLREDEIAIVDARYDENGGIVTDGMATLIDRQIGAVRDALDFEGYMGAELMKELSAYRREDTYENSNYISTGLNNAEIIENARAFLAVAENELIKSATMQHSITATLSNLLVMKEFARLVEHFEVGNWIRIRAGGAVHKLRLVGYEIDYDNLEQLPVEFSDVTRVADSISDVESILSKASSMSTSYGAVTRQAQKGSTAQDNINGWVNRGLALTKMKIIDSAENQNIQMDERGLLCREYLPISSTYDEKQLRIINRGLYLTDDGWHTSRAGIGDFAYYDPADGQEKQAYGVIADTLVGKLILSEKVGVYNRSGSITLDEDGLTLISKANGTTDVFKVQREGANGTLTDVIYFDNDGNAHFAGALDAASGTFTGTLSASCITSGTLSVGRIGDGSITSEKLSDEVNASISGAQGSADSASSATQLVYKSAAVGTTSVNAPTAWVTTATDSQGTWTIVRPTYNSDYPVLFVATQSQTVGGTVTCTTPHIDHTTTVIDGGNIITGTITADQIAGGTITSTKLATEVNNSISAAQSTADGAVADAAAAQSTANSAVSAAGVAQSTANGANGSTHIIYKSAVSGTTSMAAPTGWVSESANAQDTWTTTRPQYSSAYPVLFVATQSQTVGGTVTCTTPVMDQTTTVIDGGHITTGTIDAGVVSVTNINAENISSGSLSADYISGGTLTLGGDNNEDGILCIKDATNTTVGLWNNAGITIRKGQIQDAQNVNYWNLDTGVLNAQSGYVGSFAIDNGALSYDPHTSYYDQYGKIYESGVEFGSHLAGTCTRMTYGGIELHRTESTGYSTRLGYLYFRASNLDMNLIDQTIDIGVGIEYIDSQYTPITQMIIHRSVFPYQTQYPTSFASGKRVDVNCNMLVKNDGYVSGDFTVAGTKSRIVKTAQYSDRLLYCYETPTPMFGDIGEGVISNDGICYVALDAVFAQTISTDQYQVFLQKYGNGDCWVSERRGGWFVVEGTPGLSFGWEIKAKQRDYDQIRLDNDDALFSVPAQSLGCEAAEYITALNKGRISV